MISTRWATKCPECSSTSPHDDSIRKRSQIWKHMVGFFPCYYTQGHLKCCQGPESSARTPLKATVRGCGLNFKLEAFSTTEPGVLPLSSLLLRSLSSSLSLIHSLAALSIPIFPMFPYNLSPTPFTTVIQQSSTSERLLLKDKSWLSISAARRALFAFCFWLCSRWMLPASLFTMGLTQALASPHSSSGTIFLWAPVAREISPLNTSCQIQRAKTSQPGSGNWSNLALFPPTEVHQYYPF